MKHVLTLSVLLGVSVSVLAQPTDESSAEARPRPSGEANITLHTTITGNQEQPRVLYILPWQSPQATEIEFETLSGQYDEVFGHVEREELRRSLEAEAALSKAKP